MFREFMQEVHRKANDKIIEHESTRVSGAKSAGRMSFNELNNESYFEKEPLSGITLYLPPCMNQKYVIKDQKIQDFILNDLTTLRFISEFIIGIYIAIIITYFINPSLLVFLSKIATAIAFIQIFTIKHYSMNKIKLFRVKKYNYLQDYTKQFNPSKTISKKISIKKYKNKPTENHKI